MLKDSVGLIFIIHGQKMVWSFCQMPSWLTGLTILFLNNPNVDFQMNHQSSMNLPSHKHTTQLGTQTRDVAQLEEQYEIERDDVFAKAVKIHEQMENDGATDHHEKLQPKVRHAIDEALIGSEIELLYSC